MPNLSYWESQTFIGRPGIIIIGGGFTGLRTALAVREREKKHGEETRDILVLDRHPFGLGASTRNAGFACFGSPTELLADLENEDREAVWQTIERRYKGVMRLRKELSTPPGGYSNGPRTPGGAVGLAGWRSEGGYEVFQDRSVYERVMDQLDDLNEELAQRLGATARWLPAAKTDGLRSELPVLCNQVEAKLQPAALLRLLLARCQAAGIRLLYGCPVLGLEGERGQMRVETESFGTIVCDQVVVATNAFSRELGLDLDVSPQRNLILLTKPIPSLFLPGSYHHHEGYVYFRTIESPEGSRVLMGGARHLDPAAETADFLENYDAGLPKSFSGDARSRPVADLRKSLLNYLYQFINIAPERIEIERSWIGIIAQGEAKSPLVKRLHDGLVVAVRLAGMGVALSAEVGEMSAGELLS